MQNNKTTLIFMAVAFVLFVIVKILPKYKAPPSHTTGKVELIKVSENKLRKDAIVRITNPNGEEVATLDVQLARTDMEIDKGLMYRKSMHENAGMLFVFEKVEPQSFWMKSTSISLDILFIDEDGIISSVHKNARPNSLKPISSKGNVKLVLEVNSGFVDRNNIQLGAKLIFEEN